MNIDHLEAFIYAVHFNSIHKAADALFLSQPTVTARIKTLERELEQQLFDRSGRGVSLTEKGREFLPYAEQIVQTYEQAKKLLRRESAQKECVIGANLISSQYFLPHALPLWKEAFPDWRFTVVSASNDLLVEKLLRKELHIAFMKEAAHDALAQQPLLDNSVRLVTLPGHAFVGRTDISAAELALEPMVFFECGAFDWNRVHKIFEAAHVKPRIEFQVGHLEVAKSLIKSGAGIGFLPSLCIKNELEQGELIEAEASHLLQLKQHIYGAYYGTEPPPLWEFVQHFAGIFSGSGQQLSIH
ncbi:LysR family transcriptional regulator [Domibacillus sp. 8LH]|uniref:LysR family transcriptional regulator n=1 Tax=Domibacillus sp. 8LH TaxID=3073900 RepID=UPI00317C54F3